MNDDLIRVNTGNVPTFDGDYQKFQLWWRKFKAYSYLVGFGDAIGEDRDPNLPETHTTPLDLDTESGRTQRLAKRQNQMAMTCFTMAFLTDGLMGLVTKSITREWPGGLAYPVVKGLMKRYRPIDTVSKVEMRQQLNRISMKCNEIVKEVLRQLQDS